jgi:hypothetical protein
MELALIWTGEGEDKDGDWHVEFASVELGDGGLRASGTQLGALPVPYRLEYRLDAAGEGFATRSLWAETVGGGWRRQLRLERGTTGDWTMDVRTVGEADMPAPGGDTAPLGEALDCDIALSPLTNAMPVHRYSLHNEPGEVEFVMAWVSVPDLAVRASFQRYTHLSSDEDGATVRFEEHEGGEVTFTSDLEFARDGLVRVYPQLARRIVPAAR